MCASLPLWLSHTPNLFGLSMEVRQNSKILFLALLRRANRSVLIWPGIALEIGGAVLTLGPASATQAQSGSGSLLASQTDVTQAVQSSQFVTQAQVRLIAVILRT